MKKFIITLSLIAIAIVFFPSCDSKSGHKVEEKQAAEKTAKEKGRADSVARAEEAKRVAKYKFIFTPTKIEVIEPTDEDTQCGEGSEYKCKSFEAGVRFFKGDSVYTFAFIGTKSLDPYVSDIEHDYDYAKKAFNAVVNADLSQLRVDINENMVMAITIKGKSKGVKNGKYEVYERDLVIQ